MTYVAVGVATVLVIGGLSTGIVLKIQHDSEVKREKAALAAEKKKEEAEAAEEAAELAEQQAAYDSCEEGTGELLEDLGEVSGRLDVGMNNDEYTDIVGDLSVEYNNLELDEIDLDCLSEVAVPAEKAVNQYIRAARRWSDCISNVDCDTESLDLQSNWSKAQDHADDATIGLSGLEPIE